MISRIMILAVAACIFLLNVQALARTRHKRDWVVYGVILAAGIASTWLAAPQMRTPSPLYFLIWAFRPINDWVSSWLQ